MLWGGNRIAYEVGLASGSPGSWLQDVRLPIYTVGFGLRVVGARLLALDVEGVRPPVYL